MLQKAKAGATVSATLVAANPLDHAEKLTVTLEGRGFTEDRTWEFEVAPGGEVRKDFTLKLADTAPRGRNPLGCGCVRETRKTAVTAFWWSRWRSESVGAIITFLIRWSEP